MIYAGIDEAGYGPMFGPLLVGAAVVSVPDPDLGSGFGFGEPGMWRMLRRAVCRNVSEARGRIPVNDSKKLYSRARGLRHLELGVLAFAGAAGLQTVGLDDWIEALGEHSHRQLHDLPWYDQCPWPRLPRSLTAEEIAVAQNMLVTELKVTGIGILNLAAAVVFEDRFNQMTTATRSKAATNFSFVAQHLTAIWERYGRYSPIVVVDRQSGRLHYREPLSSCFPDAGMTVLDEGPSGSSYRLAGHGEAKQSMTVHFEVDADSHHMPVALASMLSKYTRELLMERFQGFFARHAPAIKPTAGYAMDALRFWREIQPVLMKLSIDPARLRRIS